MIPILRADFIEMYQSLKNYNDNTPDKPKLITADLARVALMFSDENAENVDVQYLPHVFWLSVLNTPFVPNRIVDAVIRFYEPKTDDLEIARKIVDLAKTKR